MAKKANATADASVKREFVRLPFQSTRPDRVEIRDEFLGVSHLFVDTTVVNYGRVVSSKNIPKGVKVRPTPAGNEQVLIRAFTNYTPERRNPYTGEVLPAESEFSTVVVNTQGAGKILLKALREGSQFHCAGGKRNGHPTGPVIRVFNPRDFVLIGKNRKKRSLEQLMIQAGLLSANGEPTVADESHA